MRLKYNERLINMKNNTGFSLVELIIVIAIMAILSAALAPQLMKYIEKSRQSTDQTTCKAIESCVNTAFTNEGVWDDVASNWNSGRDLYFYVKKDESSGELFFKGIATDGRFRKELEPMLKSLENPKQTGMNSYKVYITLLNDVSNGTKSIKGVSVTTSDYEITDDTQYIFSTEPTGGP